ncbi:hypothetical protein LO772_28765 [Yinghuangia sp. ASG 101]|uniref:hypothetical protein n=1 Tax=Yinghuangia sp. ASG 101 TaxID=2896848 RepID=UPI001E59294B|nr:hypothetical protein [Yinghuangia sp. ASG 101]UGQ10776.1 hypothetical protein LO772_28765 [Yinghuangia sp. ASG 101]
MPETPDHLRKAVQAVLDAPRRRPAHDVRTDAAAPTTPEAAARGLTAVRPHRVFEIDIADLTATGGVDAARPVGWRWLVHDGLHTVGAVEITDRGTGQQHARFTEGPFATGTDAALATLRALPHVERGHFELRLLHIPGLYTVALWLADLVGRDDLLVPLAPAPPGVQPLRPYPADELAATLADRVRPLLAAAPQP